MLSRRCAAQLRHREERAQLEAFGGEVGATVRFSIDDTQHNGDLGFQFAQHATRLQHCTARAQDVLDDDEAKPGDVAALGQPARSVALGLLAHKPSAAA